jgi:hypothetical protein
MKESNFICSIILVISLVGDLMVIEDGKLIVVRFVGELLTDSYYQNDTFFPNHRKMDIRINLI